MAQEERTANMTRCDGCDELHARLEAAEKAINELRQRLDNYSAFPSEHWTQYSVPESGGSIEIFEDGYLTFQAISKVPGAFISLGEPGSLAASLIATAASQDLWVHIPVRRGQRVTVTRKLVQIKCLTHFPSISSNAGYAK